MISSKTWQRDSLLFVYGTLRPFVAIPMARWLARVGRYLGPASTRGRLYDLGPYPGFLSPRRRGERVYGDLYRLPDAKAMRVLDRYEAGPRHGRPRFVRERCAVDQRRRRLVAYLYVYRSTIRGKVRIASGDYREHCERLKRLADPQSR